VNHASRFIDLSDETARKVQKWTFSHHNCRKR
jgi:hypothetical protein